MNRFFTSVGIVGKGLIVTAMITGALNASTAEETTDNPTYTIEKASETPTLAGQWNAGAWKDVAPLSIDNFYQSKHQPQTEAKVLYDEKGLYLHYRVADRYVRSIETKYHGKVWEDACVEFFVEPVKGRGYFNFEINCGGTMLLSYKENPEWQGESLRTSEAVPWDIAQQVTIFHSMPNTVDPELETPVVWQIEYHIPYAVFEAYLGDLNDMPGQTWRANFYKCAENNSHPHWASWSLITNELNFHQPEFFSDINFEK